MQPFTGLSRLALVPVLFAAAMPAYAVELNGIIKGTVEDYESIPVPNAAVTLESEALIGEWSTLTDDSGRYRFVGLPPGDYKVMVAPVGQALLPWESGAVRIAAGLTLQVDAELQAKGADEVITVFGEAPAVDVESTRTGAVLDSDFLKDIPVARDYQSAVAVTPGLLGAGNPYMHGGFDSANQYYVDGVNTTDPLTNTFSMNMNFDAIESIQVLTGGMDAEYGRSLGGAVNIITKSGGNEFEGNATLVYSDDNFIAAPELEGDSTDENLEEQLVINLGGPIIRDKLWFFASFEGNRFVRAISFDPDEVGRDLDLYPMADRNWRSAYLFGKLTFQPNHTHRMWAHMQTDPTWIDNVEQDPYTLPSAEAVQNQGGWLGSLGHLFSPTDDIQVETQAYYQLNYLDYFPILWQKCNERDDRGACTDYDTSDYVAIQDADGNTVPFSQGWWPNEADGFAWGEAPYASFNRRNRASLNSKFTWWADFLGQHQFRTGLQLEWLRSYYVYPGIEEGLDYYTHNGDPTDLGGYTPVQNIQYDNDWEVTFIGTIASWYVQDVYKPHPRLTIRPGVRLDWSRLLDDLGTPVFNRVTAAPRLGVAYDLTGDGKTSVRAYYGRFYDSGFLIISDLLRQKSSGYSAYGWDDKTGDWAEEPQYSVSSVFLKHDDLRNPYSDEFNFGISRQVAPDFGLDATIVYEESHNFWEDDEVNLIWDQEGSNVIGNRNGENTAIYRLRTPDDLYTRYLSFEFVARKAFSDNWAMMGSYTWSRAYGTNSADQATGVMDIPEQRQYEIGLLEYDVPHQLKFTGSYRDPDVYRIGGLEGGYLWGWDFLMRSGLPYRQVVWNSYYAGYSNYNSEQDGRYRLPAYSRLNLRAGLTFSVGRSDWMVGTNCYNLFNGRTITQVNEDYDPEATAEEQTFGQMLDRQDPRYFDIIVRGEF